MNVTNASLDQLRIANQRLEAKSEQLRQCYESAQRFVDNVSHDFRTPLTVIKEFCWLMRDGHAGTITDQQARYLDMVLNRADDLAMMVDDMLDISRLEAGRLSVDRRPHHIAALIDPVVQTIQRRCLSKQIGIDVAIPVGLPEVFCDDEKFRRVLLNLAVNAVKFTPDSGRIRIWAMLEADDRSVRVGVTDTGTGIEPTQLQKIFERFQQGENKLLRGCKGFGLGLDIARELVDINLGKIDVRSKINMGSTFCFTVPVHDPLIVLGAYGDWLLRKKTPSRKLAVYEIRALGPLDNDGADPHDFLVDHLGSDSLLLGVSTQKWIFATTSDRAQVRKLVRDIAIARDEFNRNAPVGKVPAMAAEFVASGDLLTQREQLESVMITAARAADAKTHPLQILIVDDDRDVAEALAARLETAGYRVLRAHDGQEGIATAVVHRPDAVLMDIRMPVKDGLTALTELRAHPDTHGIPVIMLSASVRDQQSALDQGARFFVQKPYDAQTVVSAIKASVEESCISPAEQLSSANISAVVPSMHCRPIRKDDRDERTTPIRVHESSRARETRPAK